MCSHYPVRIESNYNTVKIYVVKKTKKIFKRFYRVSSDRSIKSGGAGFGLAITQEIVQAHQGSLTLFPGCVA
ncbi:MAG: hypothetical protein F6K21_00655 [Symploca sp. SIO2D2]|nr:hypothetical protein [Symploca sp. SIO2D2]